MVVDRMGTPVPEQIPLHSFLRFCYRTIPGRAVLRLIRSKFCSRTAGLFMNSRLSRFYAKSVIRQQKPDLTQFEQTEFRSFNAYFTRKRREGLFPFCPDADRLCSPADSRLTVIPLQGDTAFPVKQAPYTASELLRDETEAKQYEDGYALVFRLCPTDYHRYAYPDDGTEVSCKKIPGTLHTVSPVALETLPVFHRNSREVTILETLHFGRIAFIEVGALLVGRICNRHREAFVRGEEKGYFAYGGSTVVLLIQPNRLKPDEILLQNSFNGLETLVRSGEAIGTAL